METVNFIGEVHSPLKQLADCPKQENEGAPPVSVRIREEYRQGLMGLEEGARIILFTWLDKADRAVLTTKPRNDPNAETTGVFATRSPARPNPIGIHVVEITGIAEGLIHVAHLEVLDGTPVIDIKPALGLEG